jgi:low temperature requirement protein LtrA
MLDSVSLNTNLAELMILFNFYTLPYLQTFLDFFIAYCVLVFATVVQIINESCKEVKAHQSRMSIQASSVRTTSVTLDIDSVEAAQPPNETDRALKGT